MSFFNILFIVFRKEREQNKTKTYLDRNYNTAET